MNRSTISRLSLAVAVVMLCLLGLSGPPGPAEAADDTYAAGFANPQLVRLTMANRGGAASSAEDFKNGTLTCGPRRTLTGVGADITGGGGEVILQRVGTFVEAIEIKPTKRDWYIHGYAICSQGELFGATQVSANTAFDKQAVKTATATCPPGTTLTGAIAGATGRSGVEGRTVIDDLRPNGNPATSVTVTGAAVDPDGAEWKGSMVALCADPLPGQSRVKATSKTTSANKSAHASCPSGTKVTGLGGQLNGAGGEVVIDDYTVDDLLQTVTVTGKEAVDRDGPYAGKWSVTAYALCATPAPALDDPNK